MRIAIVKGNFLSPNNISLLEVPLTKSSKHPKRQLTEPFFKNESRYEYYTLLLSLLQNAKVI